MTRRRLSRRRRLAAPSALVVGLVLALLLSACSSPQAPVRAAAAGVTAGEQTLLNLSYATTSPKQKLDLFLPARVGSPVPLVVNVHGGGWSGGDKIDNLQNIEPLRQEGIAVANINYRLSKEAVFPAAVQDTKAAIRWLRAHAQQYGVDPDRIALWGYSAGGNLAALAGVTGGAVGADAGFDDPDLGNPAVSSDVSAVVDFYGISDMLTIDAQATQPGGCPRRRTEADHSGIASSESRYLGGPITTMHAQATQASPITYIRAGMQLPPFYLAHGRADCLVPYQQSVELTDTLRGAGGQADILLLPGIGHGERSFPLSQIAAATAFLRTAFQR